jgi:hypothetical protein
MRLEAACTCTCCARPIGYENAFYRNTFAHAHCIALANSALIGAEALPV